MSPPLLLRTTGQADWSDTSRHRHLLRRWGDPEPPGAVDHVFLGPEGPRYVSFSKAPCVQVWDPGTGHLVRTFETSSWLAAFAQDPTGRFTALLEGGHEGRLAVWDRDTGETAEVPCPLLGGRSQRRFLVFSPGRPELMVVEDGAHLRLRLPDLAVRDEVSWRWPDAPDQVSQFNVGVGATRRGTLVACLLREPWYSERGAGVETWRAEVDVGSGDCRQFEEGGGDYVVELPDSSWLANMGGWADLFGFDRRPAGEWGDGPVLFSAAPALPAPEQDCLVTVMGALDLVPERQGAMGFLGHRDGMPLERSRWPAAWPMVEEPGIRTSFHLTNRHSTATVERPVRQLLPAVDVGRVVLVEAHRGRERLVLRGAGKDRVLCEIRSGAVQGVSIGVDPPRVSGRPRAYGAQSKDTGELTTWCLETGEVAPGPRSSVGPKDHVWLRPDWQTTLSLEDGHWKTRDARLRVRDVATGAMEVEVLAGDTVTAHSVTRDFWISPGGRYAVYRASRTLKDAQGGTTPDGLRVVDTRRGVQTAYLRVRHLEDVAFPAQRDEVFVAEDTGSVTRFSLVDDDPLEAISLGAGAWALAVLPGDRFLVAASRRRAAPLAQVAGQLEVWDLREGRTVLTLDHPVGPATALAVDSGGRRLFSAGVGYCVFEWDAEALVSEAERR